MGEEPSASGQGPGLSLYPSWGADLATRTVLEAIYDGPIDSRGFGYQPVILESLPTLENGGALLQPAEVKDGDRVLGDAGVPIVLAPGEKVRPAGCREGGCRDRKSTRLNSSHTT
jgi:peptide/nickel transport system substrate-binding protein